MAYPDGWVARAIKIPTGQITAAHSGFPVFLSGAMLAGTGIFDAATGAQADGGDIRFATSHTGATQLPVDLAHWDKGGANAGIWVKADVAVGDNYLYVLWRGPTATEVEPAANSAYGREAVWSGYEYVCALFGRAPTMDRTAQRRHHYYGNIPRSTRSYVVAADRPTKYAAWPSIAKMASGSLALAFRDNGDIHVDDVDGYVTVMWSPEGRNWSALSTIGQADSTRDYRDPNFYVHTDGTIYLIITVVDPSAPTGSGRVIKYFRSVDNGATFDAGTTLTATNGQARGKPILLSTGLIAVPWYAVDSGSQMRPMLTTIDPATQAKVDYVVNGPWGSYNEWSLTETAGVVRGYFRSQSASGIYTATCPVGTLGSWGSFSLLLATNSMAPIEAQRISTGDIILVFGHTRSATVANVQFRRSTDGGATLLGSDIGYIVVEDEPIANGSGYYPSFAELSPGLLVWALYADSSGGVLPTKIITGVSQLGTGGVLTGWSESGSVPVKTSNIGGTEFIGDVTYCPRQMDANNPLNYPHQNATFTLAAMVKLDNYTAAGVQGIISTAASSADKGFLFDFDGTNDQIRVSRYLGGSSVIHTSNNNAISDNNYHVVHASISAGTPTFYVDGASKGGSGTGTGTTTGNATRATNIGRYNHSTPGGALDGRIGWVYLHRSALTADWAATETNNWTNTDFAAGLPLVSGALATSETGFDTCAMAGSVLVTGALAATETGADSLSIHGHVDGAATAPISRRHVITAPPRLTRITANNRTPSMITLTPKAPAEVIAVSFDFAPLLATGESLTAADVVPTVHAGTDASPADIIDGAATISGGVASVLVDSGNADVDYKLTCTAQTSLNQTFVLAGILPVREP